MLYPPIKLNTEFEVYLIIDVCWEMGRFVVGHEFFIKSIELALFFWGGGYQMFNKIFYSYFYIISIKMAKTEV